MITRMKTCTAAQLQVVFTTFKNHLAQAMIKPDSGTGNLHMLMECHQPWAGDMNCRIFAELSVFPQTNKNNPGGETSKRSQESSFAGEDTKARTLRVLGAKD